MRQLADTVGISNPYLSQIENGSRPHLTATTRAVLARFFRVHPSYLVDDPEGFEETLSSAMEPSTVDVGEWRPRHVGSNADTNGHPGDRVGLR